MAKYFKALNALQCLYSSVSDTLFATIYERREKSYISSLHRTHHNKIVCLREKLYHNGDCSVLFKKKENKMPKKF